MGCRKLTYYQTPELRIISNRKELTSNKSVLNERRAYLYGFGGHEKVNEVYNVTGGVVDMGDRWLDTRLGRTPKPDRQAHEYPGISPYAYVGNMPIIAVDPDGERIKIIFEDKSLERTVQSVLQGVLGNRKKIAIKINTANEVEFTTGANKAKRFANRNINSKNLAKRQKAQLITKILSEDENATIEEKDFDLVIQRVASPEFFRGDDPLMQDKINSETEFSTEEQRIVDKQPGTIDTKQILEDAKNEGQTSAIDVSDPKDKKLFISKSFTSEGEKGPGYKSEVKRELRKQVKKGLPEIIK